MTWRTERRKRERPLKDNIWEGRSVAVGPREAEKEKATYWKRFRDVDRRQSSQGGNTIVLLYRDEINSLQIQSSRTQAGPGRAVKEQQGQNSPNHVQIINLISVCHSCGALTVVEITRSHPKSSKSKMFLNEDQSKKCTFPYKCAYLRYKKKFKMRP